MNSTVALHLANVSGLFGFSSPGFSYWQYQSKFSTPIIPTNRWSMPNMSLAVKKKVRDQSLSNGNDKS
jgi:hypothetical protein